VTPPRAPALAALERQAAATPEQPAVVFVDERGHWKWKPWEWLLHEVRSAAPDDGPEAAEWQPSLHGLVHALAAAASPEGSAWSSPEVARATAALARPLVRGERPIVTAPSRLESVEERAWVSWALEAGGALVLPGDAAFLAWAIWWPRATDVLVAADELAPLRELLVSFGRARTRRRQLARLRRVVVHGAVERGERAAWAALGIELTAFPS